MADSTDNPLGEKGEEVKRINTILTDITNRAKFSYKYQYIRNSIYYKKLKRKVDYTVFGILVDELLVVVLDTTLLRDFLTEIVVDEYRENVKSVFEEIVKSELDPIKGSDFKILTDDLINKNKFIYGHIEMPHPPFMFDENGEKPDSIFWPQWDYRAWADKKGYINQLIYTNKLTLEMIGNITASSKTPPIIIIQGDHGPASSWKAKSSYENPDDRMIKERFSILNAYYLPNGGNALLYDSITPVNTFRVIFNHYFGKNFRLLEDKSFYRNYYFNRDNSKYVDVTEKAYKEIKDIPEFQNQITNGDFKDGTDHWNFSITGGASIGAREGELQFKQGKGLLWIHAYQNVGVLEAGESYRISITCTDSSQNLRLGLGTKKPTDPNAYWGNAKIDGDWYAQVGTEKEYIINATPTTNGPHYVVISDGSGAGTISKIDDVRFYKTD